MKLTNWKFIALYGAYVLALHTFDGPWRQWKQGRAGKSVDPWTATHVAWGAVAERMGIERNEIMTLGCINEVVEFGIRNTRPDILWGKPETARNVIADLVATWVGWELAKAMTKKAAS